jgi:prepilin-type N-terminal cleavage/methylation domain-containing protein
MNLSFVKSAKGFTIVEIAVVIVVVAILAAISIVSYGAWRTQTTANAVRADLISASAAMENARNFNAGYPSALPTDFQASQGVNVSVVWTMMGGFCLNGVSTQNSSVTFFYNSLQKKEPQTGSCLPFVLNLASNPNPTSSTWYVPSSTSVAARTFVTNGAGNPAVRSTRLTTAAYALYIQRSTGGLSTATAGEVHTMLYTLESPVATTLTSQVGYGTGSSTLPTSTQQVVTLQANVPQQVRHTFTVPAGYNGSPIFPKILWGANAGAVGDYFELSKFMWVKGTYTGSYADGDSEHWLWYDEANASWSEGPQPW